MAELRARTIVEAHLYLDLLRAQGLLGPDDPGDPKHWTTLREGPTGWTLHADGAGGRFTPFDVVIAYRDLADARRTGLRFGTRPSALIDAGQWCELGERYAEQAIAAELAAASAPGDPEASRKALLAWRFAVDVAAEALRFLPDGAAELPDSAFWTDRGRRLRRAEPARFVRGVLEHQVATYRQLAADAADLLGGS
jgi:hypothetical protein